MPVNPIPHVTTITSVAEEFGVDEDWLYDLVIEMTAEDGYLWVYGVGEEGVLAFTDDGIDTLREIALTREDCPQRLKKAK